ncbi:MAG: elongation factor P [Opitutales bacterium]
MGNTIVSKIGKGNVITYEGHPCIVLDRTIHTPPNLSSFCTMELKNIRTGKNVHVRTNVGDSYDVLHKELKRMEFSYLNGDMYNFMDLESFEQIEVPEEVIGDAKPFLVEGGEYSLFFVDEEVMGVELPSSVEMKVIEAPEVVRGDTSGNVQKTVVLETGLEVRTPAFIKTGETIKVNPSDKSYQGRA